MISSVAFTKKVTVTNRNALVKAKFRGVFQETQKPVNAKSVGHLALKLRNEFSYIANHLVSFRTALTNHVLTVG
ncbi:unnamed protein product [Dimorphilus gyrociliatus]|uniref:Uncharacterized protein n=1 Tax=Dimorphilus gyrociliatus TaxID=2664684 RepID=A0A7I8VMX8_9ANNE|nr:unnamed protein product [Dimorphilus gyrociliatus]